MDTEGLRADFEKDVSALEAQMGRDGVENLRVRWLGRKGRLTQQFEALKGLSKEERPAAGKTLNLLRGEMERRLGELKEASEQAALQAELDREPIDITLPLERTQGALHPVTLMEARLVDEFRRLGFTVFDGPEIDFDFYNFSALNFPDDHPSRDAQDTFFVEGEGEGNMVLRTHTSNIQIHAMLQHPPPVRLVAPGRVYRVDSDLTHTPMFHQLECVLVDRGISMAHLKGIIDSFLKSIFGPKARTRLRPSFFPFVEPGAEVDMACTSCGGSKGCRVCSHTGWLEIGGCGMIHPNVFEAVGYEGEEYTGFAFGFGIDRMAMLYYGLGDLRALFEGDLGFSSRFTVYPPERLQR